MVGKDKVKSSSIDLTMDSSCIGDVLRIHFRASKKKACSAGKDKVQRIKDKV